MTPFHKLEENTKELQNILEHGYFLTWILHVRLVIPWLHLYSDSNPFICFLPNLCFKVQSSYGLKIWEAFSTEVFKQVYKIPLLMSCQTRLGK